MKCNNVYSFDYFQLCSLNKYYTNTLQLYEKKLSYYLLTAYTILSFFKL